MARRRPWPINADDHRVAGVQHAHAIADLADDLDRMNEYDRATIKLAIAHILRHAAEIERHLTLAKFGMPEEQI